LNIVVFLLQPGKIFTRLTLEIRMMRSSGSIPRDIQNFLMVWIPIVLLLTLAYRSNRWIGANPILREPLRVKEPFQNAAGAAATWEDAPEPTGSLAPADASLESMRASYALLGDVLKASDNPARESLSSAACYDADFQKRLEKTGNYRQLTNNYRRGVPDSCSQPLHDLVNKQYKVEPLPFAGCLGYGGGAKPTA
jgi:hypothetical protein